jgi:hypothetical protein
MAKLSKRVTAVRAQVDRARNYSADEALNLAKACATAKFKESVDVAVQLGIDAKKSDQLVRGSIVLPSGTGKTARVAVFAQGEKAEQAKAAGAEIVGMDDLAANIKAGQMDFDVLIASPDAMRLVGQLGQILGPRGLMPNPKVGTSGSVSNRQGWHHPLHHWPGFVRSWRAQDQPVGLDRSPAAGQTCLFEGPIPSEGGDFNHHGTWYPCGHPVSRADRILRTLGC